MATFEEYGTCCVCESEMETCGIIQLGYKVESESGWGCFQCDLPMEGAIAIVCGDCVDKYGENVEDQIKYLMDGKNGGFLFHPRKNGLLMSMIYLYIQNMRRILDVHNYCFIVCCFCAGLWAV